MTGCRAPRPLVGRRGMVARWELPPSPQHSSNRRLETATASVIGVLAEDGRSQNRVRRRTRRRMALPNMAGLLDLAMLHGHVVAREGELAAEHYFTRG